MDKAPKANPRAAPSCRRCAFHSSRTADTSSPGREAPETSRTAAASRLPRWNAHPQDPATRRSADPEDTPAYARTSRSRCSQKKSPAGSGRNERCAYKQPLWQKKCHKTRVLAAWEDWIQKRADLMQFQRHAIMPLMVEMIESGSHQSFPNPSFHLEIAFFNNRITNF